MHIALGVTVLGLMFWGCLAIIAGHYGVGIYLPNGFLTFLLHYAGPWVTLVGGYKLWNQARMWRRLYHLRQQAAPLTRDPFHRAPPPMDRPTGLERIAVVMMVTAGVSLVYWFNLPEPEYILTAALLIWFFKGFVFGVLHRRGGW